MKRLLFAFLIGISASLVSAFEIDLSYAMETPEKYKYTYEDYTSYGYIKSDVDVERVFSLFGIDLNIADKEELAKELIDFQTSFIMPSDLENVFETVGEL